MNKIALSTTTRLWLKL